MDAGKVVEQADEAGLRLVRFLWCGNDGTVRGEGERAGTASKGASRSGIGLTVAMQAMSGLDQLQPVEGMGPVGEIRLVPDLETFRVLPYAPRTGALLVDHVDARRRAGAAVPALVPEADGGAGSPSARRALEVAFENEFSLATRSDDGFTPGRLEPLLLDDRDDRVAGLRRRPRRRARRAGHPARAVLRRARPRPAGDLDRRTRPRCAPPTSRCSCARRSAASRRSTGSSRRSRRSRGPTAPATAATSTSRSGKASATASTTPSRADRLSDEARAFLAGVLEHLPGALRPDGARASTPTTASSRTTGRARSRAGGTTTARRRCACRRSSDGMEEASTNVELKAADASCNPYLARRRADRGRARRARARASSRPSRSRSTRRRSPEDERARARHPAACRPRRRRRSTRSRPTRC